MLDSTYEATVNKNNNNNDNCLVEINQVMMGLIHKLCERKQRQHLLDYFESKTRERAGCQGSSIELSTHHVDLFRFIMTSSGRNHPKHSESVYSNLSNFSKPPAKPVTNRSNLKRSGSFDATASLSLTNLTKSLSKSRTNNKLTDLLFSNNSSIIHRKTQQKQVAESRKPSHLLNFIANDLYTSSSIRKCIFSKIAGGPAPFMAAAAAAAAAAAESTSSINGFRFKRFKSGQDIRQFWRKIISEQIILSKMENEHRKMNIKASYLKERQEKLGLGGGVDVRDARRGNDLDYVEITPCLKEVDKIWTEWLLLDAQCHSTSSTRPLVDLDEIR